MSRQGVRGGTRATAVSAPSLEPSTAGTAPVCAWEAGPAKSSPVQAGRPGPAAGSPGQSPGWSWQSGPRTSPAKDTGHTVDETRLIGHKDRDDVLLLPLGEGLVVVHIHVIALTKAPLLHTTCNDVLAGRGSAGLA